MDEDLKALLLKLVDKVDRVLATQAEHGRLLANHGRLLANHEGLLAEQGRLLAEQGRLLAEHGRLLANHEGLLAEQGRLLANHEGLLAEQGRLLEELRAEQKRLADSQLRMEGQMSVTLTWLQSTDQRFGALMAPVTPPKKPAA